MHRHVTENEICHHQRSCISLHCVCTCVHVFLSTVWEEYKGENMLWKSLPGVRCTLIELHSTAQWVASCFELRRYLQWWWMMKCLKFLVGWLHITPTIAKFHSHFYLLTISVKSLENQFQTWIMAFLWISTISKLLKSAPWCPLSLSGSY